MVDSDQGQEEVCSLVEGQDDHDHMYTFALLLAGWSHVWIVARGP